MESAPLAARGGGRPGRPAAGERPLGGLGLPKVGRRRRKMATVSARLRPAKWREHRVPGCNGSGSAQDACARCGRARGGARWSSSAPACFLRFSLNLREGNADPVSQSVPSRHPKLGFELYVSRPVFPEPCGRGSSSPERVGPN